MTSHAASEPTSEPSSGQLTAAARLHIDADAAVARIADALRNQVAQELRRRGVVVAMSGGVDSSV